MGLLRNSSHHRNNLVSAGAPARNVKWHLLALQQSLLVIRQYGPTFATVHGGIQYVCGGFPTFIYSVLFTINQFKSILYLYLVYLCSNQSL